MIFELLKEGKKNYTTTSEIMAMTGLKNPRAVCRMIAEERMNGAVILSSEKGYFLPGSEAEIKQFIRTNDMRARSLEYVLKSARKRLLEQTEQLIIPEFEQFYTEKGVIT